MSCTAVWCTVLWHGRFQNNLKYLIFPIHDSLEHDLSLVLPPGPDVVAWIIFTFQYIITMITPAASCTWDQLRAFSHHIW